MNKILILLISIFLFSCAPDSSTDDTSLSPEPDEVTTKRDQIISKIQMNNSSPPDLPMQIGSSASHNRTLSGISTDASDDSVWSLVHFPFAKAYTPESFVDYPGPINSNPIQFTRYCARLTDASYFSTVIFYVTEHIDKPDTETAHYVWGEFSPDL